MSEQLLERPQAILDIMGYLKSYILRQCHNQTPLTLQSIFSFCFHCLLRSLFEICIGVGEGGAGEAHAPTLVGGPCRYEEGPLFTYKKEDL